MRHQQNIYTTVSTPIQRAVLTIEFTSFEPAVFMSVAWILHMLGNNLTK